MRTKVKPRLLSQSTVARLVTKSPKTIRQWVEKGVWPEPHSIIERTIFYRAETIEYYLEHGRWPEDAKFRHGVGRGRGDDAPAVGS